MSSRLDYRADLDGLRAVAVVPVILFHLGLRSVPGGFVGVDVFFVLSGYFITLQIARELSQGRFSLLAFYDRRIRRLFPALIAMLLVSTIFAMAVLLPDALKLFGYSLAAAVLSFSNVAFWQVSDYFGPAVETQPLLHTWSLAVEEQFYILLPVLLLLVWRYGRARLLALIVSIALLSFALSIWGTSADPAATFYLLPTRAWELALGSILALSLEPVKAASWLRNLATVAGLTAIAVPIFTYSDKTPFPGLAAALPCLGCALVIWAGRGTDQGNAPEGQTLCIAGRVLTLSPIVFIGLISYSLYLWHWPIIVFARYASVEPLNYSGNAILIVAIFGVAYVSWRLIEKPLRYGDRYWPRRWQRFAYSGTAVVAFAAMGATAYVSGGFSKRVTTDVLAISQQANDSSPIRKRCHADGNGNMEFSDTCVFGSDNAHHVVVFADSHGAELSYALSEVANGNGLQVRQITASACPPSLDFTPASRPSCNKHVEKMLAGLNEEPGATVIVTAFYPAWAQSPAFWRGFDRAVASLRKSGDNVIILGDFPPHPNGTVPDAIAQWVKLKRSPESYVFSYDEKFSRQIDKRLREIAANNGAKYVPLLPFVCGDDAGHCRAYAYGHAIYFDNHHITLVMARRVVKELILPLIAEKPDLSATTRR